MIHQMRLSVVVVALGTFPNCGHQHHFQRLSEDAISTLWASQRLSSPSGLSREWLLGCACPQQVPLKGVWLWHAILAVLFWSFDMASGFITGAPMTHAHCWGLKLASATSSQLFLEPLPLQRVWFQTVSADHCIGKRRSPRNKRK